MTSLVTIAVPTFNVARFLEPCLSSIARQTYPNVRVVVVDNASTDGTLDIARRVLPTAEVVAGDRNIGAEGNFNRCLEVATGDHVAIYHADDVYSPVIVERQVAALDERPDVGAVFALDWWINEDGEVWGGSSMPEALQGKRTLFFDDVFGALLRGTNTFLRCPSAMLRRSVQQRIGGWVPERAADAADVDLWLRFAASGPITVLPERLMKYRVTRYQGSTMYDLRRTRQASFFTVMDDWLARPEVRERARDEDVRAYLAHRSADVTVRSLHLASAGLVADARRLIRSDPLRAAPSTGARVRLHLLAGRLLRRALEMGVGVSAARLFLGVRGAGARSFLRERLPWAAAVASRRPAGAGPDW